MDDGTRAHPDELVPRVGFIATNLPMDLDWVVRFYNQRGTAEQHIKGGKHALRWRRLSCRKFRDNEVRLQLNALAYNLATFLRDGPCYPLRHPPIASATVMRMIAIHAQNDKSGRTGLTAALKNTAAEPRTWWLRRLIGLISAPCVPDDAGLDEKCLSSRQIQATVSWAGCHWGNVGCYWGHRKS